MMAQSGKRRIWLERKLGGKKAKLLLEYTAQEDIGRPI
jgi:hypothetical protein